MNRKDFLKTGALSTGSLLVSPALALHQNNTTMECSLTIRNAEKANICKTCGTRYADSLLDIRHCPICMDNRQYLREYGQQWVSYKHLKQTHSVKVTRLQEDIFELTTHPSFAIGQRALLITTPYGNVLWDCIPLLDEASAAFINSKGGLNAIVISHPHYYSLMAEWAEAFQCPVYLHEKDRKWVMDESDRFRFWGQGQLELLPGITVIHLGGHFPGSSVLQYLSPNGKSSLLTGDTLYLSRNKQHISIMYSYPNVIPLPKEELFGILDKVNQLPFDSLYGAFSWQNIYKGAKDIVENSMDVYHSAYAD